MKAQQTINYLLASASGVTAIVGNNPPRIHYVVAPQEAVLPMVTHKVLSSQRIEGTYTDPGYAQVRVQVTCFASSYKDLASLVEQVRLALERVGSGPNGTPINGVTVYDIKMGSEIEMWIPEIEAFGHAMDFTVLHAE